MVDLIFWIDGITASGVVVFGVLFGLFFIYKSKKTGAKMLTLLGIANLGVFLDFFLVIFTSTNFDNTFGMVGIISYIWLAPAVISAIYIGGELLVPKAKWYLVSAFVVLSIVFYIILFMDPYSAFNFNPPSVSGDGLIDYNLNILSLAGIIMGLFLILIIIILGFGFLIKSFQSTGVLKKKYFLLSMGALCFCIFGLLEGLVVPGFTVIFVRIGYLSSFWFMYYGLKD